MFPKIKILRKIERKRKSQKDIESDELKIEEKVTKKDHGTDISW